MARTITFEGRSITVPDDATDTEIAGIIEGSSPAKKKGGILSSVADTVLEGAKGAARGTSQVAAGALKGASNIGTAILSVPYHLGVPGVMSPKERKAEIDKVFKDYVDTDSLAFKAGEIAGETAGTAAPVGKVFTLATKPFQVAKDAGRLKRAVVATGGSVAGGAAAGGAGAALTSHDIGEGAALGAALGPATAVLTKPIAAGGQWLAEKGAQFAGGAKDRLAAELRDLFEAHVPEVVATLRALRGEVPGERMTAGMAANARFPELKALQEYVRSRPGAGVFTEIEAANELARFRPLERMADPGKRVFNPDTGRVESELEVVRQKAASPLFQMAGPKRVEIADELEAAIRAAEASRPAGVGARSFQQAEANRAMQGAEQMGGRQPAGQQTPNVPEGLPPWSQHDPYASEPFMPRRQNYTIDELQRISGELADDIDRLYRAGDMLGVKQLNAVRQNLNNAMVSQVGEYALGKQIFKNFSAPQNQADVAQQLLTSLRSPTGAERAGTFLGAIENAPRTLKRADQSSRFQDIREVMTPDQMREINAITRSLRREGEYANLKAPQGIIPKYLSPAEQMEKDIPGFLNRFVTATRSMLKRVAGISDEETQRLLSEAVANPNKMADLLEMIPAEQRSKVVNLIKTIRQSLPAPSLVGGMAGGQFAVEQE